MHATGASAVMTVGPSRSPTKGLSSASWLPLRVPPRQHPALTHQLRTPHRSIRTHHLPTILLA